MYQNGYLFYSWYQRNTSKGTVGVLVIPLWLCTVLLFPDPSLHFLAAQGEIAKIKEEIDKGLHKIWSQFIIW